MSCLLDTHTLLWTLFDPGRLPKKVRSTIESRENQISASAVSFWEISLKFSLGKLELPKTQPEEIPKAISEMGFSVAELTPQLLASYHQLEIDSNHRDPFDRLLVWQAIQNRFCLISKDKKLQSYHKQGLQTLW